MSDNEQKQDITSQQESPQSPDVVTDEASIPLADSTSIELPPVAPEAPRDAFTPVTVEDQNGAVNEENSHIAEPINESKILEPVPETAKTVPAPAPLTSATAQTQSLAQQDERGFIKSLLIKAQAKIQLNKQKKLDKLIQFAQEKKIVANDDVQKLLRVSDATATRYLVKLVQQGRIARVGSPRDAKYQFVR